MMKLLAASAVALALFLTAAQAKDLGDRREFLLAQRIVRAEEARQAPLQAMLTMGILSSSTKGIVSNYLGNNITHNTTATQTFTGCNLGSVVGGKIIVLATCRVTAATDCLSVTVDGVAAYKICHILNSFQSTSFWMADSTGVSSGSIVVNWNGTVARPGIAFYSLSGDAVVYDYKTTPTSGAAQTLYVPAGGSIIGGMSSPTTGPNITTWTNLTEDFDITYSNLSANDFSGAHADFPTLQSAQSVNCTITTPSTAYVSFGLNPALGQTANYLGVGFSGANPANPYTNVAMPIGTAARNRVVVAIITTDDGVAGRTFVSATIQGIPANVVKTQLSGTGIRSTGICWALVPTGTTADIVITCTSGTNTIRVATYAVYGASETVAIGRNSAGSNASGVSVTLNANRASPFIIAGLIHAPGSACVWTGVTQAYNGVPVGTARYSDGYAYASYNAAYAISATNTATEAAMATVAFAP